MEISDKDVGEIIKRLDILISLTLETAAKGTGLKIGDKISKLTDLGIAAADVGKILGKQSNYVTATLSQRKARKRKGKNGNE